MTRHLLMVGARLENVRLTLPNREVTYASFWFRVCLDGGKMGEERKWEERKWRGKKMGEKMLSLIMLGWMRENRKEGKWVGEVGYGYWTMLCNFSLSYNPPILGGKTWEENGACGPPTFPLPFSFFSHFLPIQARENTFPRWVGVA